MSDELTRPEYERIGRAIALFILGKLDADREIEWYGHTAYEIDDETRDDVDQAVRAAIADRFDLADLRNASHGYEAAIALGRECVALLKGI